MTTRVTPHRAGTLSFNGRSYTGVLGSTYDVPDFDAALLEANGWTAVQVGVTANRPAAPQKNQKFLDSTLGYTIVWDGFAWRNPATGASV